MVQSWQTKKAIRARKKASATYQNFGLHQIFDDVHALADDQRAAWLIDGKPEKSKPQALPLWKDFKLRESLPVKEKYRVPYEYTVKGRKELKKQKEEKEARLKKEMERQKVKAKIIQQRVEKTKKFVEKLNPAQRKWFRETTNVQRSLQRANAAGKSLLGQSFVRKE